MESHGQAAPGPSPCRAEPTGTGSPETAPPSHHSRRGARHRAPGPPAAAGPLTSAGSCLSPGSRRARGTQEPLPGRAPRVAAARRPAGEPGAHTAAAHRRPWHLAARRRGERAATRAACKPGPPLTSAAARQWARPVLSPAASRPPRFFLSPVEAHVPQPGAGPAAGASPSSRQPFRLHSPPPPLSAHLLAPLPTPGIEAPPPPRHVQERDTPPGVSLTGPGQASTQRVWISVR